MKKISHWLETHAVGPTYKGWVLIGISLAYLGAAINTLAGWLYVISGISLALLGISAILPARSLKGLTIKRHHIEPVTAGDDLKIEIEIYNSHLKPVNFLEITDILPFILNQPIKERIETIASKNTYKLVYYQTTNRRGIYRWQQVELATSAPWDFFICRRYQKCTARATVYPTVLLFTICPLVDEIGQDDSDRGDPRGNPLQLASTGLVRSLRSYRIGDPTRLIHWRTSARYGELRVRELEIITGGQEITIALDSAFKWNEEKFEQAVIAAASLYFYAKRQKLKVNLWTAETGLVTSDSQVLDTLAAINPLEGNNTPPDSNPLVWLTQNPYTISSLPLGSRWVLWEDADLPVSAIISRQYPGIIIQKHEELQTQLQKQLDR